MKCPNCGGPRDPGDRHCAYCQTKFDTSASAKESKPEIHIHYHQEAFQKGPKVQVETVYVSKPGVSSRSRLVALALCLFLGGFGIHRFYLGKIGTGVLFLLTNGWFFIGWIYDLCILLFGHPTDKQGHPLKWT